MRKSRLLRKVHNFVLKTITLSAAVTGIISACMLDNTSYVPHILCAVSVLWLMLFGIANGVIGGE